MSTSTDKANVVDIDRNEVTIDPEQIHIPMPAGEMVNEQVESSGIMYIVPDGFYIPKENQQPPGWLVNIIALVVRQYVGDTAELDNLSAQITEMLKQLEEMKGVYEQQEKIEQMVSEQVNALISPMQNTIAGLNQRIAILENNTFNMGDVNIAIEQHLATTNQYIALVEENTGKRFDVLEQRMDSVEDGEITHFDGLLDIESEGLDADFYNNDRMDMTNEVIHVYNNRQIVLQIGDLTLPVMKPEDFDEEPDDFEDDPEPAPGGP